MKKLLILNLATREGLEEQRGNMRLAKTRNYRGKRKR